jgi:hypothetical protein
VNRAACLAALLAAAAAPARAAEEPIDCPAGTHRVSTDNPYAPFRCATADEDKKGFDAISVPNGFTTRPRCPRGTRPVAAAGSSLQPYRCVRATSDDPDPELAPMRGDDGAAPEPASGTPSAAAGGGRDPLSSGCPQGLRKVRKNDLLHPYQCAPLPSRGAGLNTGAPQRYSIAGQIAFEYPSAFRVQDAWSEDVPTLYLKIDDGSAGKPVTITITRVASNQSTYQDMDEAIKRDVEWQGAKDGGTMTIGPARARVTELPGDTRSVYLPVAKESYYSFVYSAPADSYKAHLPGFSRLLKSLKLPRKAP